MKIKKLEFISNETYEKNIDLIIQAVIEPFTLQIESRSISVKIAWRNSAQVQMKADWEKY